MSKTYEEILAENDDLEKKLYALQYRYKNKVVEHDIIYMYDALFTMLQFQIDLMTKILLPDCCSKENLKKYPMVRKEYLERAIQLEEHFIERTDIK